MGLFGSSFHPLRRAHQLERAAKKYSKRTLSDLGSAAINAPAGMLYAGAALSHDTAGAFGHLPGASRYARRRAHERSHFLPVAKALGVSTYEDFRHPLRHPGYTLLDLSSALSFGTGSVARGAGLLGGLREAEGAGRVGAGIRGAYHANRTAARAPAYIHHGGETIFTPRNPSSLARYGRYGVNRLTGLHDPMRGTAGVRRSKFQLANAKTGDLRAELDNAGYNPDRIERMDRGHLISEVAGVRAKSGNQFLGSKYSPLSRLGGHLASRQAAQNEKISQILNIRNDPTGYMDEQLQILQHNKAAALSRTSLSKFGLGALDTTNSAARTMQLYAKGSYLPLNMVGQVALSAAHHPNIVGTGMRATKLARGTNKAQRAEIGALMGYRGAGEGGIIRSTGGGEVWPGVKQVSDVVGSVYSKALDEPWRFGAFANEMKRYGYPLTSAGYEAMRKTPDIYGATQRANKALIDYGDLGKTERNVVRRLIYFYPWLKGSTKYAARFPFEHPLLAGATTQQAKYGQAETTRRLGDAELPSYMQGTAFMGHRNVPGVGRSWRAWNPAAGGILGQSGQILQALTGTGIQGVGTPLTEFPAPIVTGALGLAGIPLGEEGRSPGGWQGLKRAMVDTTPLYQYLHAMPKRADQKVKDQYLFPINHHDISNYFLGGGFSGRPVNEYVRRSRYRGELAPRLGGKELVGKRSQWTTEDLQREHNKLVQSGKIKEKEWTGLPPWLSGGVQEKAKLDLIYQEARKQYGRKLRTSDRAATLMKYMVAKGMVKRSPQLDKLIAYLESNNVNPALEPRIRKLVHQYEKGLFPRRALVGRYSNKVIKPLGGRISVR